MRFSSKGFTRIAGFLLLAVFCVLAMPRTVQAGFDYDENGYSFVSGQAIITFKPGTSLITIKSVLVRNGADPSKIQYVDERSVLVKFDERKDVLTFCNQMAANAWTTASCPNYTHSVLATPNDTYYTLQWGLKPGTAGVTPTTGADLVNSWGQVDGIGVGTGTKVAILDTGIAYGHPELLQYPDGSLVKSVGTLHTTMTIVPALPVSADGTSHPPYAFANNAPNDDVGHGTHVAGIIAARTYNSKGVAGGAPSALIYPIKVGNRIDGSITDATIAAGIRVACSNGCRVINMSLGGINPVGDVITNAIQFAQTQTVGGIKGVVCVAAMGKDFNQSGQVISYPAVMHGVVPVGAHGPSGATPAYAITGPWMLLAAPGGDGGSTWGGLSNNAGQIFSTYPPYNVSLGPPVIPKPTYTNYSYMSGSSMAAAHVSAAAALLLQKKPHLSWAQVWAQLALYSVHTAPINTITSATGSVTPIPDTACNSTQGYGLLNANSLLQAKQPALGKTTGIPHVFPILPRNQLTYEGTNWSANGLQNVDRIRANYTNIFRVIVVDDAGERMPGAQVTASFRLITWSSTTWGYPPTNISDTVMLDNGDNANNGDLLSQDCVYSCKIHFPAYLLYCVYEMRYLVTAPGYAPNTNRVANFRVIP